MLSVQAIEEEIQQLPKSDLAILRDWFLEFDDRAWDKQIALRKHLAHCATHFRLPPMIQIIPKTKIVLLLLECPRWAA